MNLCRKKFKKKCQTNRARILFDNLMEQFAHLDYYLSSGSNGEPVLNKASDFELAVCKSQEGTVLKHSEKNLKSLSNDDVEEIEDSDSNFVEAVLAKKIRPVLIWSGYPRLPIARNDFLAE